VTTVLPTVYVLIVAGVSGLVFGSSLNVCVYRFPRDESITGRSYCPSCNNTIAWYDNVPVVSWVLLGGKCRHCGNDISLRYPLVELLSAGFMMGSAYVWLIGRPDWMNFGVTCVFLLVSLGITLVDLEFSIIPNEFNYFLLLTGLILAGIPHYPFTSRSRLIFDSSQFVWALLGMLVGGGLFYVLAVVSPYIYGQSALGMGDVKLIGAYGLWLGPKLILFTIVFGALTGAVVGTVLMLLQGKSLRTEIPFGPYLCLGGVVALFWGESIVNWYLAITAVSS